MSKATATPTLIKFRTFPDRDSCKNIYFDRASIVAIEIDDIHPDAIVKVYVQGRSDPFTYRMGLNGYYDPHYVLSPHTYK